MPTTAGPEGAGASYASAGVDIEAGERAVDAFRPFAEKASRPEVMGGIGGFAGLFALKLGKYSDPVLAASTDGVGTKVAIAQAMDKHDTIGLDLVAMVVDDLVVCGAEPLFLQDYIAVGKVVPEHVAMVVKGIAEGCQLAGCALLGGETAEHPGMMEDGGYDVSATGVGIVEADAMLRPDHVRPGDVLVAMGSSGLHSNGYSLARHVLLDIARLPLEGHVEELEHTLGEELLVPTTIYARDCLALAAETGVRTFAHITGGGLARNLERVLPGGLDRVVHAGQYAHHHSDLLVHDPDGRQCHAEADRSGDRLQQHRRHRPPRRQRPLRPDDHRAAGRADRHGGRERSRPHRRPHDAGRLHRDPGGDRGADALPLGERDVHAHGLRTHADLLRGRTDQRHRRPVLLGHG